MMTMDCPRCGFSQPKDRYCASCGLDVEQFARRPVPLVRRVTSNPNTYLALVGLLLALLGIFLVSTRVPAVFRAARGTFISSRDAADAEEAGETPEPVEAPPVQLAAVAVEPVAKPAAAPLPPVAPAAREMNLVEAEFFAVPQSLSIPILTSAERVTDEQSEGQVFLIRDPAASEDWLKAPGSRRLGPPLRAELKPETQLTVETPPSAPKAFRFGLDLRLTHWKEGHLGLRFASYLSLLESETPAEMASPEPVFKRVIDTSLNGSAELTAGQTLVILIEPPNRRARKEFLNQAGAGPWVIFRDEAFQRGELNWVAVVRLR